MNPQVEEKVRTKRRSRRLAAQPGRGHGGRVRHAHACAAVGVALLAACAGGGTDRRTEAERDTAPDGAPRLDFLALGDSYTIGEGVAAGERWPAQLVELLRARGVAIEEPQIVARTGWTTEELREGIERADPAGGRALVSLLIGVNDQYRGHSVAEYRRGFGDLLRRAIGFAGDRPERVVVLSIPDWGVTPFAAERDPAKIAEEIDAFNAAAHAETENAGARWVEITSATRELGNDPAMLVEDGLHPSGVVYDHWARLALPAALAALGTPDS
jgi:lysophospholipase L1-like esterase